MVYSKTINKQLTANKHAAFDFPPADRLRTLSLFPVNRVRRHTREHYTGTVIDFRTRFPTIRNRRASSTLLLHRRRIVSYCTRHILYTVIMFKYFMRLMLCLSRLATIVDVPTADILK